MSFTLFDALILAVITISSMLGMYRGTIQIIINFIGFIASIFFATLISPYVKILLYDYISNELIIKIASGTVSYILSLIIFTIISSQIISMCCSISKGPIDRIIGLGIGFLRGLLLSIVIFIITAIFANGTYLKAKLVEDLVLNICSEEYPKWLKKSLLAPYLEELAKSMIAVVPVDVLRSIELPKAKEDNVPDTAEPDDNKNIEDKSTISVQKEQND